MGLAFSPVLTALLISAFFLNSSSEITACPFLNHVTDNAPDADYYSQITAFIGVLFGVGVPVGFQIIEGFGKRYKNDNISKFFLKSIKRQLCFYAFYTFLTILPGILFSYFKISNILALFVVLVSAILSIYYAFQIVLEFKNVITQPMDTVLRFIEYAAEKGEQSIASIELSLFSYSVDHNNKILLKEFLGAYFAHVYKYIKENTVSQELRVTSVEIDVNKPDKIDNKLNSIGELLLIIDKSRLMCFEEVFREFDSIFKNKESNEDYINLYKRIMAKVEWALLIHQIRLSGINLYYIRFEWLKDFYYQDKGEYVIDYNTKNTILRFLEGSFREEVKNKTTGLVNIESFIHEIHMGPLEKYTPYKDTRMIAVVHQELIKCDEINSIDKLVNQSAYYLKEKEFDQVAEYIETLKAKTEYLATKEDLEDFKIMAYDRHKSFLMACEIFKAMAWCIYYKRNDIIKMIVDETEHEENTIWSNHRRIMPKSAQEVLQVYDYARNGFQIFNRRTGEDQYSLEIIVCLFMLKLQNKSGGCSLKGLSVENKTSQDVQYFNAKLIHVLSKAAELLSSDYYDIFSIKDPDIDRIKSALVNLAKNAMEAEKKSISESILSLSKTEKLLEIADDAYFKRTYIYSLFDMPKANELPDVPLCKRDDNAFSPFGYNGNVSKELFINETRLQSDGWFRGLGEALADTENHRAVSLIYDMCVDANNLDSVLSELKSNENMFILAHSEVLFGSLYKLQEFTPEYLIRESEFNKLHNFAGIYEHNGIKYPVINTEAENKKNYVLVVDVSKLIFKWCNDKTEGFEDKRNEDGTYTKLRHTSENGLYFEIQNNENDETKVLFDVRRVIKIEKKNQDETIGYRIVYKPEELI